MRLVVKYNLLKYVENEEKSQPENKKTTAWLKNHFIFFIFRENIPFRQLRLFLLILQRLKTWKKEPKKRPPRCYLYL